MPFQGTHFFGASDFYNGVTSSSLRANTGDSPGLLRTMVTGTSRRIFTWSGWIKRNSFTNTEAFMQVNPNNNDTGASTFGFRDEDDSDGPNIQFSHYDGSSYDIRIETNAKFRDVSNWYHIVLRVDTTQSTNTNRVRIYVNGDQYTSLAQSTYPSQNFDTNYNVNSTKMYIAGGAAANAGGGNVYFDSYVTEINYVDGLSLGPDSFGETKNGVWIPKNPSVTDYGNNGFRLQFKNSGTGTTSEGTTATTNIGDDSSGSGHNFSVLNYAASDVVSDHPENNFSKLNFLIKPHDPLTFTEGGLKISRGSGSLVYSFAASTFAVKTGKWYAEWRPTGSQTAANHMVGISTVTNPDQSAGDPYLENGQINYVLNGTGHIDAGGNVAAGTFSSSNSYGDGDVVGIALDLDSGTKNVKFYKNGSQVNSTNLSSHFDDKHIYFYNVFYNTNAGMWNFGQDSTFAGEETAATNADENGIGQFHESVPSGYLTLCSSNLDNDNFAIIGPDSASQSDDFFNSVLYTGDATSRNITGVGFQPDLVWIKPRSDTDNHVLLDTPRGGTKYLMSNRNDGHVSQDPGIPSFDTDGFSIGNWTNVNENTQTYVAWSWAAGGAPSADNSAGAGNTPTANSVKIDGSNLGSGLAGTIPATRLTANTTSGFSIVTYTGTGTQSDTVAHGLGKAPAWYMTKSLSEAQNWHVFHKQLDTSAPEDYAIFLNASNAKPSSSANFWNSTAPTTSVVSVGDDNSSNKSSTTYVMYCYAEIEGYSKFGSYTGNGNNDGPFVYTGFTPAWVMIKNSARSADWRLHDIVRQPSNDTGGHILLPNQNSSEITNEYDIDFLSNGFKLRSSDVYENGSGELLIYFAFAKLPFKFSNARA